MFHPLSFVFCPLSFLTNIKSYLKRLSFRASTARTSIPSLTACAAAAPAPTPVAIAFPITRQLASASCEAERHRPQKSRPSTFFGTSAP